MKLQCICVLKDDVIDDCWTLPRFMPGPGQIRVLP